MESAHFSTFQRLEYSSFVHSHLSHSYIGSCLQQLVIGRGNPQVFLDQPILDPSKTCTLCQGYGFSWVQVWLGCTGMQTCRGKGYRCMTDVNKLWGYLKNKCYSPQMVSQPLGSSSSSPMTSSPSTKLRSWPFTNLSWHQALRHRRACVDWMERWLWIWERTSHPWLKTCSTSTVVTRKSK